MRGVRSSTIILGLLIIIAVSAYIVYATINSVTLVSPANNTIQWHADNVSFNCTADITGTNFANATLYHNASGTFSANITNRSDSEPAGRSINLTLDAPFPEVNEFRWGCYVQDADGNTAWSGNFTLSVDATIPDVFNLTSIDHSSGSGSLNNTISTDLQPNITWNATTEPHFINYTIKIATDAAFTSIFEDFALTNVTNTTYYVNISNASVLSADTRYYINVTAYEDDGAGVTRASTRSIQEIWLYTTDNTAPLVQLSNGTADGTWFNDNNVTLFYNASDLSLHTCTLYTNTTGTFAANQSNTSLSNPQALEAALVTLDDGHYAWDVWCNDTAGNANWSTALALNAYNVNWSFYVDKTFPSEINYSTLVPNDTVSTDLTPSLNWTNVSEVNFLAYTIELSTIYTFAWINYTANETVISDTNHTVSTSLTENQTYFWRVVAWDRAGNWNQTNTTGLVGHEGLRHYTTDNTASTLALLTPANDTWDTDGTVTFNVTVAEDNLASCRLYLTNSSGGAETYDHSLNSPNATGGRDAGIENRYFNVTLTLDDTVDDHYLWNVNCSDRAGNVAWLVSSGNNTIKIDTIYPEQIDVTKGYANNTYIGTLTPTLNFTNLTNYAVNSTNFENYTIHISADSDFATLEYVSVNRTQAASPDYLVRHTVTSSLNESTRYYWRVESWDNASLLVTSSTGNFSIDTVAPELIALWPPVDEQVDSATVNVNFTVYDFNPASYCRMYFVNASKTEWTAYGLWNDSYLNATYADIANNSLLQTNFTLGEGNYTWSIYCTDNTTDTASTVWQANRSFSVDTTAPAIVLQAANNSRNQFTIAFNDTTASTGVNISSLGVTIDGVSVSNFNVSTDCGSYSDGATTAYCTWIEDGLNTSSGINSLVTITGSDMNRNLETEAVYVHTNAATNFTVQLASGLNFISTPAMLQNTNIDIVFANNTAIDNFYYFNSSDWTIWYRDTAFTDTLTTLEPRKGYWVKTNQATKINFFGNYTYSGQATPAYASLTLPVGWHTIGSYNGIDGEDDYNSSQVLSGLLDAATISFTKLQYWSTSSSLFVNAYQSTNPQSSAWESDKVWDRGSGFWIYMSTEDTYN